MSIYKMPNRFMFSGRSHVPLNSVQTALRDAIQDKLDKGYYKLEDCHCLCGADDDVIIAGTDRYGFAINTVICRSCGILRIDPRPSRGVLKEFYSREYQDLYWDAEPENISDHFRAQVTGGVYMKDFIKGHLNISGFRGKTVMEIGCSAGGILLPFLEDGADVRGYDYNKSYLEYGRSINRGLDLRHGGIDEVKNTGERFDFLIMNHVLEHLVDPKEAVQTAFNLLKDGGILYLSVPSIKNANYYKSHDKSYLGSLHIAHLYHFSRNALMSIMDNFEPIFVDEKVRGIFKRSPGKKAEKFPREYDSNIRFILWRENSVSGLISRKFDVFLYGHYFYTRLLRAFKFLPKRWLSRFTF
ncbi:MAG: methyltransferase domain-containing protein [Candidatus Omnitrophica bacterium]|nr:methyltransferase domain-containing protein [Candidatus Omnitrophota bacterium]